MGLRRYGELISFSSASSWVLRLVRVSVFSASPSKSSSTGSESRSMTGGVAASTVGAADGAAGAGAFAAAEPLVGGASFLSHAGKVNRANEERAMIAARFICFLRCRRLPPRLRGQVLKPRPPLGTESVSWLDRGARFLVDQLVDARDGLFLVGASVALGEHECAIQECHAPRMHFEFVAGGGLGQRGSPALAELFTVLFSAFDRRIAQLG